MLNWQPTPLDAPAADSAVVEVPAVGLHVVPDALPDHARWKLALRRLLSLAVAVPTLVLVAPLLVVIAATVKLTSRGPVLFRQQRVRSGGRTFTMLKFRTMHEGTVEWIREDPQRWAAYAGNGFKAPAGFARVTPLGRVLRKTSLDELPQLFNVVRGHMSLVGVRPRVPIEYAALPERSRALYGLLDPGMTGLWQVEGRSLVTPAERLTLDDRYVTTWNPWRDVVLLARTPAAVARVAEAG